MGSARSIIPRPAEAGASAHAIELASDRRTAEVEWISRCDDQPDDGRAGDDHQHGGTTTTTSTAAPTTSIMMATTTASWGTDLELKVHTTNAANTVYRSPLAFKLTGIPADATVIQLHAGGHHAAHESDRRPHRSPLWRAVARRRQPNRGAGDVEHLLSVTRTVP